MSDEPVEGIPPSTGERPRVGLREAYGFSGVDATPDGADVAALLRGVVAGATAAILGREATAEELAQAEAQPAASGAAGMQARVQALITTLLLQPGARGGLPASVGSMADAHDVSVFDAVVRACFRALLGREADDHAVQLWRNHMLAHFQASALDDFMFRFMALILASAEWNTRFQGSHTLEARRGFLPPHVVSEAAEFTAHLSLGSSGFASGMLKRYGLKRWSGPFDWMSASPAIIRDILADDFRDFLDPSAWSTIAPEDRPDGRYFQCRHLGLENRHGMPAILHNADIHTRDGLASLTRCVERFRASIRGLAAKLVLQVAPEGDDPVAEFARTADLLDGLGRSFRFVMVSILPDFAAGPFPEVEPAARRGRHRLLRVRMLAPIIGIEPLDRMDELVMLRAVLAAPGIGDE